jgi:hypothetical protein
VVSLAYFSSLPLEYGYLLLEYGYQKIHAWIVLCRIFHNKRRYINCMLEVVTDFHARMTRTKMMFVNIDVVFRHGGIFLMICYFASLSAQVSQYFSISTAPSTLNNASLVAMLPQLTQNFGFLPTSTNDLSNEKTLSICYFIPAKVISVEPIILVATVGSEFFLMY